MNRVLLLLLHLAATLGAWTGTGAEPASPPYFELRVYTVVSNQLDAVVERFRDTVEPVRRKHGIRTVAYWSSPGPPRGGIFAYLMTAPSAAVLQEQERKFGADPEFQAGYAASARKHGETVESILKLPLETDPTARMDLSPASTARAFELRIYSLVPGRQAQFRDRWRDHAVPIYRRHHLDSLAWWMAATPGAGGQDRFVCLLAGGSATGIQDSITAFHQDPEWIQVQRDSESQGPLRSEVTVHRLTPTPFSPLQ